VQADVPAMRRIAIKANDTIANERLFMAMPPYVRIGLLRGRPDRILGGLRIGAPAAEKTNSVIPLLGRPDNTCREQLV
jgi:hypothetical protein